MQQRNANRLKAVELICRYESLSGEVVELKWEMDPWDFELSENRNHQPFTPPGKTESSKADHPVRVKISGKARAWGNGQEE